MPGRGWRRKRVRRARAGERSRSGAKLAPRTSTPHTIVERAEWGRIQSSTVWMFCVSSRVNLFMALEIAIFVGGIHAQSDTLCGLCLCALAYGLLILGLAVRLRPSRGFAAPATSAAYPVPVPHLWYPSGGIQSSGWTYFRQLGPLERYRITHIGNRSPAGSSFRTCPPPPRRCRRRSC